MANENTNESLSPAQEVIYNAIIENEDAIKSILANAPEGIRLYAFKQIWIKGVINMHAFKAIFQC